MYTPTRPEFAVFKKAEPPSVAKEWTFDFNEILSSPRKVRGKFHTPLVDKDKEYIGGGAVRNAVPHFMHLPILHDFHKERTVGIVTRVVELSDGSFDFEGLIKATDDCNDVWELIEKGNYDQVSIYGKRTCGSKSCSVRPEQRMEPCVTTAVRLDSISVCDEKARNEGTSLYVAKGGKVVFTANDELIKAETTDSSLMHTATDYPDKKGYRINSKGEVIRTDTKCRATCPQYERQDLGKGEDMSDDEVDKGKIEMPGRGIPKKGKFDSQGRNAKKPEEPEKKPESSWAGESKKSDEVEEASVEGDAEESIESKLDKLEMIIEGLVQKDQEAKGGDIPKQDPGESYELPPEAEREYGAPSAGETREDVEVEPVSPAPGGYDNVDKLAAHIHLSSKVGEGGAEEKAVPKISLTDRKTTSPEEVQHWKEQYEGGKGEYQAQRAAKIAQEQQAVQQGKESYANEIGSKKLQADASTVDAKAIDPARPEAQFVDYHNKQVSEGEVDEPRLRTRSTGDEVVMEHVPKRTTTNADKERNKSPRPKKDERPVWSDYQGKQEEGHGKEEAVTPSWKEKGTPEGSKEVRSHEPKEAPKKDPEPSKDVKRHATFKDKKMNEPTPNKQGPDEDPKEAERRSGIREKPGDKKPYEPKTEFGVQNKKEFESMSFQDKKKGTPTAQGNLRDETKEHPAPEEKAGEMPDINSRLDRLIAIVAQLVQSDAGVHAGMDNPGAEEEKAISKGTETMKDEEVDTLVKAKVAAEVETISKAYQASLDELKKANTDLASRIEKMENETISKSGVAVILREGDGELGTVIQSNAAAISAITKAKKAGA